MARSGDTIWELIAQAAESLPEPFSRSDVIRWVAARRSDIQISSISAHIQVAIAETPNRETYQLGGRPPLLQRVDRGLYRQYRGAGQTQTIVPAGTAASKTPSPPATDVGLVLVGCSSRKATTPAPARDLFLGSGFQRARDYAIRHRLPWFVLSAKFGLLEPDTVVSPYDMYLADQSRHYRSAWGEWVVARLSQDMPLRGAAVEVHAGEAYSEPLRAPLERLGASLLTPLAGLRQGERLAWPGYRSSPDASSEELAPTGRPNLDLDRLLDVANSLAPAEFIARGSYGLDVPGLYTWWVDEEGARVLSAGMGSPVRRGLLYAGKAGGHRDRAAPSSSTLWGRIAGNHLRGNIGSSTFRKSLAAVLGAAGQGPSEQELSAWMFRHLRVATLPVASEIVASLEDELVARTAPPLNLAGLPREGSRSTLSRLRSLVARQAPTESPETDSPPADSGPGPAAALERRLRADVDAMIRSGYRPTIFQRMLAEHGALNAARRLLAAPQVSDGFRYLWEHGMLQHSVENAVLDPQFSELFTVGEQEIARGRLLQAGFRP